MRFSQPQYMHKVKDDKIGDAKNNGWIVKLLGTIHFLMIKTIFDINIKVMNIQFLIHL